MLAIIIILLVAFILTPLIDLTLNERTRTTAKIIVYAVTFVYILYLLLVGRMLP